MYYLLLKYLNKHYKTCYCIIKGNSREEVSKMWHETWSVKGYTLYSLQIIPSKYYNNLKSKVEKSNNMFRIRSKALIKLYSE